MPDERGKPRISQFPGRRNEVAKAVAGTLVKKDQPAIGGSQGAYTRDPCGSCLSWRRDPRAGQNGIPLTAGQCFLGPPIPHPIAFTEDGRVAGVVAIRPPMASDSEGCDQHDDGTDDDTDGDGEPASAIARVG